MEELHFNADITGERIDKFLDGRIESLSRSYIQKLIKEKKILVNQLPVKANYKLTTGDTILLQIPDPEPLDIQPENIPLDILYEDDDILVVNKPKGMVVHPAPGHYSHTLVNAVLYHCGENLSGINGVIRPGIVHRIDMNTTGSLLICKNDKAHQILAEQLKEAPAGKIVLDQELIQKAKEDVMQQVEFEAEKQAYIKQNQIDVREFQTPEEALAFSALKRKNFSNPQIKILLQLVREDTVGMDLDAILETFDSKMDMETIEMMTEMLL